MVYFQGAGSMYNVLSRSEVHNILSMIEGHHRFLINNTGETIDRKTDHFVLNNEGVLANNRHFIADTRQEYQPDGDGTTEGQSLLVLGYIHLYLATKSERYLAEAERYWQAYVDYFYAGQPIPDTPQRWICNWIINSKEPVLANYPVNPVEPTHSGFKAVELNYTNGLTQVPHGAPYFGEWLDVVTFAFYGALGWESVNANVYGLLPDGSTDWNNNGIIYEVDWMIAWTGEKISGDGNVISTGHDPADFGKIQLKNTTINGPMKTNFSPRPPVSLGGQYIGRNQPQHNRPLHVPLLGSVNQMGNAADAEVWFADCCWQLWKITNNEKYKKALDCVMFTLTEYTDIDASDMFFRQSTISKTPFTDGISYDYSYPSETVVTYDRDAEGYITMSTDIASSHTIEQQAVQYRITKDSICHVVAGGVGNAGKEVGFTVELTLSPEKRQSNNTTYVIKLAPTNSLSPVTYDIPLSSFAHAKKPDNTPYHTAEARTMSDYGSVTWKEEFANNVLGDRNALVVNSTFPDDSGGLIYGFWLLDGGKGPMNSVTYSSTAEMDLRFEDDNGWRWYWILPNTNGAWLTFNLDKANLVLSGYQPNHPSDPSPSEAVYSTVDQVTFLLENSSDTNVNFKLYCMNDVPVLFNADDGWTQYFALTARCEEPFTAKVGNCRINNYRLDSLAYCPGLIPFSNIYQEGTEVMGAWHGMPYPGYQAPLIFMFYDSGIDQLRLDNSINFLYDSQEWYTSQFGISGPGASAYIWDRWDNYKYGSPDTWTMYHWGDSDAWSGYQPRAFYWACRSWQELYNRGEPIPNKLKLYCENWARWLIGFGKQYGITPSTFPMTAVPVGVPNDFTGHMTGLWLGGMCLLAMCGSEVPELDGFIEVCVKELHDNYIVTPTPGHMMNGSWSPWESPNDNEGMYFGFWAGEIFRGLAIYLEYLTEKTENEIPVVVNSDYIVSIKSSYITENLDGFPIHIELADMPDLFWDEVKDGGVNIRAMINGSGVPCDVAYIDKTLKVGSVYVRADLKTNFANVVVIRLTDDEILPTVDSPSGRNAVWVDYEAVYSFPSMEDRTGKTSNQISNSVIANTELISDMHTAIYGTPHQGVAVDGDHIIGIDTNELIRVAKTDITTAVVTNSNPIGQSGLLNVNHVGDGCIVNGELFVPIESYPAGNYVNQYIAVFDAVTLQFKRSYDISQQNHEASSIAYRNNKLYITDFVGGNNIYVYNMDGTFDKAIPLSQSISGLQGITFINDTNILLSYTNYIVEAVINDVIVTIGEIVFTSIYSGSLEGIEYDATENAIYQLLSSDGRLLRLKSIVKTPELFGRLGYFKSVIPVPSTQFTMGATVTNTNEASPTSQMALLSYGEARSDRATLLCRSGGKISTWNSSDSWFETDQSFTLYSKQRLGLSQKDNEYRKVFVNGVSYIDGTVSPRPGDVSNVSFYINAKEEGVSEAGTCTYQFAWLRHEILSDAWMLADSANENAVDFYSITKA